MEYKLLSKLYYKDKNEYEEVYTRRFNSESSYHFNIKISGNEAFCCLIPEIFNLCNEISNTDKLVFALASKLPQAAISQFAAKSLVDEIILTNDIEGVYSTRKEINLILKDAKTKDTKKRFEGLVAKYKMLSKAQIPLKTCEDIRNIYDELVLSEVVEDDPGNMPDGMIFRKDVAEVTTATQKVIHKGLYPEEKVIDYMEQALRILNDEAIPLPIRISIFHYLFGYIHPFYDGNGRTSRFISSYLLSKEYEYLIGYRLSYTIKENISDYYEAFKLCNDEKSKGDLTPFVIMFLKIIKKSMDNLFDALYKRKEDLEKYSALISKISGIDQDLSYVLLQGALFSNLGIDKNDLCETLQIGKSTLSKRLNKIDELGYLVIKKNGRSNYYSFDINCLK
ncbi:MAG: Fic family protein [Eubacteriales bacterium]|nr:Fic family protein [Eubacteriales bacterium]